MSIVRPREKNRHLREGDIPKLKFQILTNFGDQSIDTEKFRDKYFKFYLFQTFLFAFEAKLPKS